MTPSWPPPLDHVPAAIVPGGLHVGLSVRAEQEPDGNHPVLVHAIHPSGITIVNRYGGSMSPVRLDRLALDLTHPLGRYAIARALNAYHLLPRTDGGALPDEHARHSSALLCCDAWRRAAGMEGIAGVLGVWKDAEHATVPLTKWPSGSCATRFCFSSDMRLEVGSLIVGRHTYRSGWWLREDRLGRRGAIIVGGPETGPAGRDAADRAALEAGYALLGDAPLLPWPASRPEVARAG